MVSTSVWCCVDLGNNGMGFWGFFLKLEISVLPEGYLEGATVVWGAALLQSIHYLYAYSFKAILHPKSFFWVKNTSKSALKDHFTHMKWSFFSYSWWCRTMLIASLLRLLPPPQYNGGEWSLIYGARHRKWNWKNSKATFLSCLFWIIPRPLWDQKCSMVPFLLHEVVPKSVSTDLAVEEKRRICTLTCTNDWMCLLAGSNLKSSGLYCCLTIGIHFDCCESK